VRGSTGRTCSTDSIDAIASVLETIRQAGVATGNGMPSLFNIYRRDNNRVHVMGFEDVVLAGQPNFESIATSERQWIQLALEQ
jgi:hypothetical protein